jgi:uncharacterized membrane protein YfcA
MIGAIAIGLAAGIVAGLLGVGGGVLFVPGPRAVPRPRPAPGRGHLAAGDRARGDRRHLQPGSLRQRARRDALLLGLLSLAGAAAGVALANALSGAVLRDAFAALMVLVAAQLVHRTSQSAGTGRKRRRLSAWDSTTHSTSRSC